MVRMRQVEHGVTHQYHQLLVLSQKRARERMVLGFHHDPFSDPLPELLLGSPELFSIAANDQGRFFFFFFFLALLVTL